ncbi:NB-ARC domains-containing protein [Tanacetum coccineum]
MPGWEVWSTNGGSTTGVVRDAVFPCLKELLIIDCPSLVEFSFKGDKVFPSLQELSIVGCSILLEVSVEELPSSRVLTINGCAGLWPPNLRELYIGSLKKPISEWGPQKFPTTLVGLVLDGETDAATNWSQLSHLHLPSSLARLGILKFENLETVSEGLQHLTSLQYLEFSNCPTMKDLQETLFPSLLSLIIEDCPILKERCSRGGSYWPQISHIPCTHWNQSVLNLTLNVRNVFTEMDNMLFLACQARFLEEQEKQNFATEKRKEAWDRLENAASLQPISGNTTAVLVSMPQLN